MELLRKVSIRNRVNVAMGLTAVTLGLLGGGGFLAMTAFSQCVAATCETADHCDGEACGVAFDVCGDPVGHYCRAPADVCAADADCAANERCSHNGLEWQCVEQASCE